MRIHRLQIENYKSSVVLIVKPKIHFMALKEKIKNNPQLKSMVLKAMIPRNRARPRLWVRWFINPFVHHKGKRTGICKSARIDVLPYYKFSLGDDSIIEDFATINNGVGDVFIGKRSRIGLGSTLIGPLKIGNDVLIAQNVVLSALNHKYEDDTLPISRQGFTKNAIVVEDEVWIAANCVILSGVTIGKHAIVSAGSVVRRNVPSYSIVTGNPAKVIKRQNPETKIWEWKI